MAAPTLQAEGATATGVTTGVPSITIPTHQADDIVVVTLVYGGTAQISSPNAIPTPTNYTAMGSQVLYFSGATAFRVANFWRRVTGAGTTITVTRGGNWDTGTDTVYNGRAYVIRGCITSGDPFDAVTTAGPYTTANQNFPSVTVSGSERCAIVFGGSADNAAFAMNGSGYTAGTEDDDAGGIDSAFQTSRQDNVSSTISAVASVVSAPAQCAYGFIAAAFKPPAGTLYTEDLTGGLSFSGSIAKQDNKALSAGLTFVGGVAKQTAKALAGGLSFSGGFTKKTIRSLTGGLSFSGSLDSIRLATIAFNAALTFSGSMTKQAGKALAGSLTFSGSISRSLLRSLSASLSFVGLATRETRKSLTATLAPAGTLAKRTARGLAAALSFVGDLTPTFLSGAGTLFFQSFEAAVSFSASLVRSTQKALAGSVTPEGSLVRRTSRSLAGSLSFTGNLDPHKTVLYFKELAGTLTFSGSLVPFFMRIGGDVLELRPRWLTRARSRGLRRVQ